MLQSNLIHTGALVKRLSQPCAICPPAGAPFDTCSERFPELGTERSEMYRGRGRSKKALRTTLGTAVTGAEEARRADLAHLRKPIETSLFGLRQVLGLFEAATDEVKDYICYECELIYECRTCRSIFRSLANFILHKRQYCKERYRGWCRDSGDSNVRLKPAPPSPECVPMVPAPDSPLKDACQKTLSAVISKLEARQKSEQICANLVEADLLERHPDDVDGSETPRAADIALQEIEDSISGVFQTVVRDDTGRDRDDGLSDEDLIKSEVMEIHSILNNDEVILGPDGKILSQPVKSFASSAATPAPQFNLTCKVCRQHFSTKKTLTQHVKYKHNRTKLVYLCPESGCDGSVFANTWSVFRHLYKVHRKTSAQVKKLRSLIQSNVLRRGQVVEKVETGTAAKKEKGKTVQQTLDEENIQWMDNFEGDNDLQMCGGCGKRFERRAALNSHSQMCQRRQAVCNSMKETRRPEIPKLVIKNQKVVGSQKRKNALTVRKTEWKQSNATSACSNPTTTPPSRLTCSSSTPSPTSVEVNDEDSCDGLLVMDLPEEAPEVIVIDTPEESTPSSPERNIYEPDVILVKKESPPVVYVSDDEEQQIITLETKAAGFMDVNERKCIPCDHFFETIDALLRHMATHFKWFHFQCDECLFKSYDHTTLQAHLFKQHAFTDFQKHTVQLTHHEIVKNSVDFQPLFEDASERKQVTADPSVQKMIMEVIFGNISGLGESNQRPVRNRVVPKKDDFVYEDDVRKLPGPRPLKVYSKKRRLLEEYKP